LRVTTYDWLSDGSKGYGVIAQEAYKVLPEMVAKTDEGIGELGDNPWSVANDKLIPYLLKAVQELSAEIEVLKRSKKENF
jgi:hypothetical protein